MATREQYNTCMKPYISGQHEDRKLDFCIGAKMCAGKASTEEEARQICLLPKEPKAPRTRRSSSIDIPKLASCVATTIALEELTAENLVSRLQSAMQACSDKPTTSYKRFMNACLKEQDGTFKTQLHDIKVCKARWAVTN